MKKLLGIMAISALAASAFAQGTVTLGNQTGLIKQWTSASDPTVISVPKSGGYVQLIAAPKGTALPNPVATSYSSLAGFLAANPGWAGALGPNTGVTANPALIAAAAGVINGGTFTINNIAEGAQADYFLLGWTVPATTWNQALITPNALLGQSAIFTTATSNPNATPPGTPTNLKSTFTGMTLVAVPEPSTFALAGLGAAAMLIFRRRK